MNLTINRSNDNRKHESKFQNVMNNYDQLILTGIYIYIQRKICSKYLYMPSD